MPRSKENSSARKSRSAGVISGTTIEVDGLAIVHGILAIGSGATLARQSLGLSRIHNVIHSPSLKGAMSAVTGVAITCVPQGTKSFGSNCTQVAFAAFKLNRAGVTFTAGVSVNYTAFGTFS